MDSVSVLVDNSQGAEHIESIIDSSLHVLEVHAHTFRPIDLEDSPGDIGARRFSVMHNFLKNFF
jgi:hypothetical protein